MINIREYPQIILRGIGQIMLQENALTGMLFLIGISFSSINMALATALASLIGTLTALLLKYNKAEIKSGLYGFSPALVGVAMLVFFKPILVTWLAIVIGSIIAAVIQHYFITKKIAVFTLPFVVVTWVLIYVFKNIYPIEVAIAPENQLSHNNFIDPIFNGYGQVIFQGSIYAGIAFFIGVALNSKISALYGILASALGATFAYFLGLTTDSLNLGLFGYNAVLCAIVFSGKKLENLFWACLASLLSVAICLLFTKLELTALTFPFVAATCLSLVVQQYSKKVFNLS